MHANQEGSDGPKNKPCVRNQNEVRAFGRGIECTWNIVNVEGTEQTGRRTLPPQTRCL